MLAEELCETCGDVPAPLAAAALTPTESLEALPSEESDSHQAVAGDTAALAAQVPEDGELAAREIFPAAGDTAALAAQVPEGGELAAREISPAEGLPLAEPDAAEVAADGDGDSAVTATDGDGDSAATTADRAREATTAVATTLEDTEDAPPPYL
jgi:hypothetical protein